MFHGSSVDFYVGLRIELVPPSEAGEMRAVVRADRRVCDRRRNGGTRDDSPRVVEQPLAPTFSGGSRGT